MPELPEVEVIRTGLLPLIGSVIESIEIIYRPSWRYLPEKISTIEEFLFGRRIEGIFRRGKYLWLRLDSLYAVVIHLGMSGQLLVNKGQDHKHRRIALGVVKDTQYCEINFIDQRTFGGWSLSKMNLQGTPERIEHIACDIFDSSWNKHAAVAAIARKKSEIKRVLLDQTVISGIGNIYADESLWHTKIHPRTVACLLEKKHIELLLNNLHAIMSAAIAQGGTSFDALYVAVNGQSGRYSSSLTVYGRADFPCLRCGHTIVREKFMGRSSWYCPLCQQIMYQ